MLEIVQISKYYPPYFAGVPNYVQLLSEELKKQHRVTVLTSNTGFSRCEEVDGNLRVIRVPRVMELWSTVLCPTLLRELSRLHADIVHLHFPDPMAHLAYWAARSSSKLVITWHGDISRYWFLFQFYRPILRHILRRADRIIVTSPTFRDGSRQLEGMRERCTVLPFGIDVGRFKLTAEVERQCEALRKRFGERIVLFVGRLHEQKGLEYLLRAMVGLQARLVLVGTGYLERFLRSLAAKLRIGDNVVFEGPLPPNEIVPYLYASSFLVLPSVNSGESFGIVQLEAMICGKPVVSTDLPTGVPWVNQNGITGLIVPPRDVETLHQAMRRLLLDPQLRHQLGEVGRQRVVSEFTHKLHMQRMLGLYDELVQEREK